MKQEDKNNLKELFIEFCKTSNEKVFEKIYNKYSKLVHKVAFSILKNNEDSEDIGQMVFTKIYKMEKEKLPSSKIESWLYTVTK